MSDDGKTSDARTPAEIELDIALKRQELTKGEVELEVKRAELDKKREEAKREALYTVKTSIEAEKFREARDLELANDHYARVYQFVGKVDLGSVEMCMDRLSLWDRLDPTCDMEIVFHSPGGGVVPGFALFDHIKMLERRGHRITATGMGYAASMAGVLLQAGTHRRMGREAWLLIHEGSMGVMGSMAEVEDTVEWSKRLRDRFVAIYLDRAAGAETRTKALTRTQFAKKMERKDWWLSSEEALAYGFIDEIV